MTLMETTAIDSLIHCAPLSHYHSVYFYGLGGLVIDLFCYVRRFSAACSSLNFCLHPVNTDSRFSRYIIQDTAAAAAAAAAENVSHLVRHVPIRQNFTTWN